MSTVTHLHSSRRVVDKAKPLELVLTINSFAGGENTIGEDQAVKMNEARRNDNWEVTSLGGMQRIKGINEVADGGVSYTNASDFLIEHKENSGTEVYGVCEGDLVIKSASSINQEDAAAFTSGLLCHGVSAGGACWITNSTDNLKRKTIGGAIAAATDQPAEACARIYSMKERLIAEGAATTRNRIYGSRAGSGNWNAADGFSASNDAWNIDLPNDTQGCAPAFPSGNELLAFTKFSCYSVYNFPNVAYRPIPNGRGCAAPHSIAVGDEGVFFLSDYPTLGVYLFDGVNFVELTQYNKDVFVEKINFSNRIHGVYKDKKYYLIYNETGSGVNYQNRIRIYDTRFGAWMRRPINDDLADNLGYPALLKYSNNELYCVSSRKDKWYEVGVNTDDEGNDTEAVYETKDFSSRDFFTITGSPMPVDDIRMKLVKATMTAHGTTGQVTVNWNADRSKYTGSVTFDLSQDGDIINDTFTVNTSKVVTSPPDATKVKSFKNTAVGRRFHFQINNSGSGVRPTVKRLKIHAIAMEEA